MKYKTIEEIARKMKVPTFNDHFDPKRKPFLPPFKVMPGIKEARCWTKLVKDGERAVLRGFWILMLRKFRVLKESLDKKSDSG